jgi:hypothetical protein
MRKILIVTFWRFEAIRAFEQAQPRARKIGHYMGVSKGKRTFAG